METVDRIMRAYSKTRELTHEQAELVRNELTRYVHEMMFKSSSEPARIVSKRPLE
jgi:hypothetical protein